MPISKEPLCISISDKKSSGAKLSTDSHSAKKVHKTFMFTGALFQLTLFPVVAMLFTSDQSIGLLIVLFFPLYLLGGGLLSLGTMAIIADWHIKKQRFIRQGWWLHTFMVGYIVTALFFIIFLSSVKALPIWLAISVTGGLSAVLAGMSSLPVVKTIDEDLESSHE